MTDAEIAPCLNDSQLAEAATEFTREARLLGNKPYASTLRAWCIPALFTRMEELLDKDEDPVSGINTTLRSLTKFLSLARCSGLDSIGADGSVAIANGSHSSDDVEDLTGNHYGNLFKEFSSPSYWDEPLKLLKKRLERNGIGRADFLNRSVLDAGCGGGRYSAAWRLLGANPVVGVDISAINIGDAARRASLANLDGISFEKGNVLDLPYDDAQFDIVYSNGVLHHTTDWKRGVAELMRVLKPGGWGWLYLIENPGGIFWDVIEILRVVMKNEDKARSRLALRQINMPANRIFYMLDHVMVPINLRLSRGEIEDCLHSFGAEQVRRLARGADIDRIEHIFRGRRFAAERFGIGENRYVFTKPASVFGTL